MRSLRPCATALLGSSAVCTQCHSSGRERSGAQCTLKSTPVIKSHLSAACTWAALLPTMDSILHWVSCSRAGSMGEMAPDLNKNCFSLSCGLRLWAQQRFFVVHQKHKTIILRGCAPMHTAYYKKSFIKTQWIRNEDCPNAIVHPTSLPQLQWKRMKCTAPQCNIASPQWNVIESCTTPLEFHWATLLCCGIEIHLMVHLNNLLPT